MIIPEPLVTVEKGRKKDNSLQREKKALLRAWYKQMQSANASDFDKKMLAEKMYREGSRLELPGLAAFLAKLVEEHTGRNPLTSIAPDEKPKAVAPVAAVPASPVTEPAIEADAPVEAEELPATEEAAEQAIEEVVEEEVVEEPELLQGEDPVADERETDLQELGEADEVVIEVEAVEPLPPADAEDNVEPPFIIHSDAAQQQKGIILLGPLGAGKTTQARLLHKKYGMALLSLDDMLEQYGTQESKLAMNVNWGMRHGRHVVDDETLVEVIAENLGKSDCSHGFVLDGFPNTMAQTVLLHDMLADNKTQITNVIALEVGKDEILRRYEGKDDLQAAESGLKTYSNLAPGVLSYYRACGILSSINGAQPVDKVARLVSRSIYTGPQGQ